MGDAREARRNGPEIQWPRHTVPVTVLAFDPGGTTGWCAMQAPAKLLIGGEYLVEESKENTPWDGRLETLRKAADKLDKSAHIEDEKVYWKNAAQEQWESYIRWTTGQIDCEAMTFDDAEANVKKHNGLMIAAEDRGVGIMVQLAREEYPDSAIVMEDFILDFKKADMKRETLSPVRLTSAFSYGLYIDAQDEEYSVKNSGIFIQGRSNVKTTCTDERLKNWGLYDRYSGDHARDATRHAYYFLRASRGGSFEAAQKRYDAWPHLFQDPYEMFPDKKRTKSKTDVVKKLGERIHL